MTRNRLWTLLAVGIVALVIFAAVTGYPGLPGCRRAAPPPAATQPAVTVPAAASQDGIYLYFTPGGSPTQAIVEQISHARQTLEVEAYQFTSGPIAKAVLEARKRGVQVTIVLDRTQEGNRGPRLDDGPRYSSATFFHNQGIPVFIDRKHDILHSKVMLIDGRTIITGSFNFTGAAQTDNAENLLILQDKPQLYAAYERTFREHLKHAARYEPASRETRPAAPSRQRSSGATRQPARSR